MEDAPLQNGEFKLLRTGDRLCEARKAAGMSLEDVAGKTRVPMRHLEAIEANRFGDLPGRTYVIGFAKAYAEAVDLEPEELIAGLREEMADAGLERVSSNETTQFSPEDPAKVPSAKMAWMIAAAGIALLVGGYTVWRTVYFPSVATQSETATAQNPSDSSASASQDRAPAVIERQADGSITAPASGDVVFTATADNVWVKFYDGSGKQLLQKQMALGERYIVPGDADNPQIWTGRPDAFAITVGGTAVAPLGTSERAIKDVPISAAALLARQTSASNSDGDGNDAGNGDDG